MAGGKWVVKILFLVILGIPSCLSNHWPISKVPDANYECDNSANICEPNEVVHWGLDIEPSECANRGFYSAWIIEGHGICENGLAPFCYPGYSAHIDTLCASLDTAHNNRVIKYFCVRIGPGYYYTTNGLINNWGYRGDACPHGTFGWNCGLTTASDCTSCPEDTYNNVIGRSTECPSCSASLGLGSNIGSGYCVCVDGWYSEDEWSLENPIPTCIRCPAGYACRGGKYDTGDEDNSRDWRDKKKCIDNTYSYSTMTTECISCASGKYTPPLLWEDSLNDREYSCQWCASNKKMGLNECIYCISWNHVAQDNYCTQCPHGYIVKRYMYPTTDSGFMGLGNGFGDPVCSPCDAGTYAFKHAYDSDMLVINHECRDCPVNTYSQNVGGSEDVCTPCSGGTHTNHLTGQIYCNYCEEGYGWKNWETCELCPRGSYSNGNQTYQGDCMQINTPKTIAPNEGMSVGFRCPWYPDTHGTSYNPRPESTIVEQSNWNGVTSTDNTRCTECLPNTFVMPSSAGRSDAECVCIPGYFGDPYGPGGILTPRLDHCNCY
jgi:hypothetical protein